MKIVVTGAGGLLGRHVMADLGAHGHVPLGVDRVALPPERGRSVVVDLTDIARLEPLLDGADALVHLARVPFPYASSGYDPASRTWKKPDPRGDAALFATNVAMTNNALAAAATAGVRRVVMGSSFAVYGLYYPSRPLIPERIPVDESHPRKPDDAYGLTKLIGEDLADAYASKLSAQVVSLRFPGVSPGDREALIAKRRDPMARGTGGLWTYVDVRDAATACRLALERTIEGHQAFNICAPTTFMDAPTPDLLQRYLPTVKNVKTTRRGNWAGYDTAKAKKVLGFVANHLLAS